MKKRPTDTPEFSQMVIHKYLSNEEPTKRELSYWLFDLSFNINIKLQEYSEEESLKLTDYFYYEALDYVKEAISKKYGLRDAVIYVRYRLINEKNNLLDVIEMNEVKKIEDKYFKKIIKMLKEFKRLH